MAVDPKDLARLHDMMEAAQAVVRYIGGKSCDEFVSDELLIDAVQRRIQVIGEAARHISTELSSAHPEIPWRLIIKQRHVLVHDYDEIDFAKVYRVATQYVPELIRQLEPLVNLPPHTDTPLFDREQE